MTKRGPVWPHDRGNGNNDVVTTESHLRTPRHRAVCRPSVNTTEAIGEYVFPASFALVTLGRSCLESTITRCRKTAGFFVGIEHRHGLVAEMV